MKNEQVKDYDAVFETYGGKNRFEVSHPEQKRSLKVAAPNEAAATIAAASRWGVRWQEYSFYAWCTVTPV